MICLSCIGGERVKFTNWQEDFLLSVSCVTGGAPIEGKEKAFKDNTESWVMGRENNILDGVTVVQVADCVVYIRR